MHYIALLFKLQSVLSFKFTVHDIKTRSTQLEMKSEKLSLSKNLHGSLTQTSKKKLLPAWNFNFNKQAE